MIKKINKFLQSRERFKKNRRKNNMYKGKKDKKIKN